MSDTGRQVAVLLRLQARRWVRRASSGLSHRLVLALALLSGSYYFVDFALDSIGGRFEGLVLLLWGVCLLCFGGELLVRDLRESDLDGVRALPLTTAGIFAYRVVMRAFPRGTDACLLLVTLLLVATRSGWGAAAAPLACLLFLLLLVVFGSLHAALEPALFLYLDPGGRRTIQRVARVLFPVAGVALWLALQKMDTAPLPAVLQWGAPGLVAGVLRGDVGLLGLLVVEVAVLGGLAALLMERVLSSSGTVLKLSAHSSMKGMGSLRACFSPYQVQLLRGAGVTPTGILGGLVAWVGAIFALRTLEADSSVRAFCASALGTPGRSGVLAVLLASFFRPVGGWGLPAAGPALWMLATVPRSLASLMAEGAQLAIFWSLTVVAAVMGLASAVWLPPTLQTLDVALYASCVAILVALLRHYGEILGPGHRMSQDLVTTILIGAVMVEAPLGRFGVLTIGSWITYAIYRKSSNQLVYFLGGKTAGPSRELTRRSEWDPTVQGEHHVDQAHANRVSS